MDLYISAGSPFARVARIVALELGAPVRLVEETGFPPQKAEAVNPALQVPALVDGERRLFGTRLIVEYLMEIRPSAVGASEPPFAASSVRKTHRWRDAQLLVALETLLNALVLRSYLIWTGAEHQRGARIDLDLRQREEKRAARLLDWLETEAGSGGFLPGVLSLQDVWLIAIIEWSEARQPFKGLKRPALEAIQVRHAGRPSVVDTRPPPWS